MKYKSPQELIKQENLRLIRERRNWNRKAKRDNSVAERRKMLSEIRRDSHDILDFTGDRVVVHLPQVLSLDSNYSDSMRAINLIRDLILNKRLTVMLDFSGVEYVGAAAALVLTAEIIRCRNFGRLRARDVVSGTYPKNQTAHKILRDIGFYNALKIHPLNEPEIDEQTVEHIHIRMQSFSRIDAPDILAFRDTLLLPFPHLDGRARQRMQGGIVEAVSNCFDHAFRSRGDFLLFGRRAWLSGYVDVSSNEFMIMVFDQGAGISRTLDTTVVEWLRAQVKGGRPSDSDFISAATQLRRTSTGQSGRGRGFETMKRFVEVCDDGELRVFSNRGLYTYNGDKAGQNDWIQSLGGTLVQWRIRHHKGEFEFARSE